MKNPLVLLVAMLMSAAAAGRATAIRQDASWREPFDGFRIIGHVYPAGYNAYIARSEQLYLDQLKKERR